jgi:putative transposase
MTRRAVHRDEIDLTRWPHVDGSTLTDKKRALLARRSEAIHRYIAGATLTDIRASCGIGKGQFYHLLDRCLQTHEDGTLFGYRGLIPYGRQDSYTRSKALPAKQVNHRGGNVGAFGLLLEAHPGLSAWLKRKIRERVVLLEQLGTDTGLKLRMNGISRLHGAFMIECRSLGLNANDYPFTTESVARRSLAKAYRDGVLAEFGRAARASGATHLKGMPVQRQAPWPGRAFEVVEFDGHRLDLRLKIVITDPLGFEQQFEIERIWLLAILDVYSRAILGYHVSLEREYNRHDVVRTVINALVPHVPRQFVLPELANAAQDGFPSGKFPETAYAQWTWFKMDGAKANGADDVRHALTEFIGCFIDVGPSYSPDDRPYIERFFGTIATRLSSRLPGFTGSHPADLRRALSDPKGDLRLCVSLTELEDLLEATLAAYNATPHDGLNGRTPLEAVAHSIRVQGHWLSWLPEARRRGIYLMHTPKRARVRAYLTQGQRPHVNFFGVRYTNLVLAASTALIGTELKLYYDSHDLRTIHAIARDGADMGLLKAQGVWGELVHDLALRQEILRQRGRKHSATLDGQFVHAFVEAKKRAAGTSRRAGSELAKTLRTLAQPSRMPTSAPSPAEPAMTTDHRSPTPQPVVRIEPRSVPVSGRIEPQVLQIGSGFSGSLEELLAALKPQ